MQKRHYGLTGLSIWLLFGLLLGGAASAQTAPPAPDPSIPRTALFQIVLLIGDKKASGDSDDVPENVKTALDDVREFLPYKGYRVVDTALIRSEGETQGLMSGPDDHTYKFFLHHLRYASDDRIHVRSFQLIDQDRNPGNLIGTSFSVEMRETIVVGTSKLNGGDEALLVLFTAVR